MASFMYKIARRLVRKPRFKHWVIVTKTLDGSLPAYQARIPFDFEVLPQDVERIEASWAHIPAEHRPDIERRIHNGELCTVAKHNGQIIYVSWMAFGKCYAHILDREYELAEDEAYWYGAYALPEFRGKGIHPATGRHVLQLLKDRGYKRILGFVDPKNPAALRSDAKLGFGTVGITGFIEMFGFRWYFHRDRGTFSALKRRNYWRKM